jgi:hypothetical protein
VTSYLTRVRDTPTELPSSDSAGWYQRGMSSCPDCGLGADHCHGTLVVHIDRTVECTDAACELADLLRHLFIVECIDVLGGCCVAKEAAELAAAS